MRLVWDINAWKDYVWWQSQDRKTLKRIKVLVQDIIGNGNDGIESANRSRCDMTSPAIGRGGSPMNTVSFTRSSMMSRCGSRPVATTTADRRQVHETTLKLPGQQSSVRQRFQWRPSAR